ncbi:hypothetical protein AGMMS50267_12510 [Spirochaetia bacterium]|nr:hypothetical protein AGMMS50267_12510 [Spirochaetia bacterium]
MAIKTYLDSSVLINAYNSAPAIVQKVHDLLTDPNRSFIVGDYVFLEIMPKAYYTKRLDQAAFYADILRKAVFIHSTDAIIVKADELATMFGLAALDALHAATAIIAHADELVTFEKPSKPFFRIPHEQLPVLSLYLPHAH